MHSLPALPAGYRQRASTVADIDAVHQLVGACERDLLGHHESDRACVAATYYRPGLDPALDTMLIHDAAGRLVARAWVNRRCEVDVHPDHRSRGLGDWLLYWVQTRAAECGTKELAQTVDDADKIAGELLSQQGFLPKVTAWLLEIAMTEEPEVAKPPSGVEVRAFRSEDAAAAHVLIEDAFSWQGRRQPFEEWAVKTVARETFAPDASMVAVWGGRPVGVVLSIDDPDAADGYIEQVAVNEAHRGRGIARTLLRHAFRAFHHRGRRSCILWTHSATGALPLYERAGMTVRRSSTVYKKQLFPSKD
jgi:mycothiol synthase